MFKKFGRIKKIALTILLCMVFGVSVGATWAMPDYELEVTSKPVDAQVGNYSYYNDIVVNNSTTLVPIPYTNGTVAREISFDYGFSETMDIVIVYKLKYTDGSSANNVKLNIANRDDYLLDAPTVNLLNGVTAYNQQADSGTLYYLKTLTGHGNQVVFSGVTFAENNNQVATYKAGSAKVLYKSVYAVGDKLIDTDFAYTHKDIARYWSVSNYSNGTTEISAEEYANLSTSEQPNYSVSKYKCIQAYSVGSTSIAKDTVVTATEYATKLTSGDSNWTDSYECVTACTIGETSYAVGDTITSETYSSLSSDNKANFRHYYTCKTAYTVQGANTKTVSAGTTITASEYSGLYELEQAIFSPESYVGYENKRLKIEVDVYTKLNASSVDESASAYYNSEHEFAQYKQSTDSRVYNNWISYKQSTTDDGTASVQANRVMIYNAHGSFDSGLQYAYDFSYDTDLKTVDNTPNITTQYLYNTDGKIYTYAGGNRYDGGLGLYYMANEQASIRFSVGWNWYNTKGELTNVAVNNVEAGTNSNFTNYLGNNYGFTKLVSAGSFGYIDLIEYIQITTKANIFNLIGYKLVITTVEAEITTDYSAWSPTGSYSSSDVVATSSSESSPVLYKYAEMSTATTLNASLSLTNNSNQDKSVSVTVSPKFYAYNGLTSEDYALASTKSISLGDSSATGTRFNYKSASWTKSGTGDYTFTSSGIYLAPHTTVELIESVYLIGQTLDNWKVTVGSNSYYSDYWFVLEVVSVTSSTATTNKTSTSSAELITELKDGTISSGTTYIAVRNNTSQTMSNITFSGKLVNKVNSSNTVNYSLLNYATNTTSTLTNTSTISVAFTGINLLPGESIILAKITITSGANVGLNSESLTCSLSSVPTYSTVYAKRDFASGNLSVINASDSISTLSLSLKNFAGNVTISNTSALVNGDKWTYSTNFVYKQKTGTDNAYIHNGQIINLLADYFEQDIQTTII